MDDLNELPQSWKWVKLGDVCSFEGGSQPEKSFFKYQPLPDYIRLVQIQDFRLSHVSVYIPKKYAKRTFNEDDVMIGRYGPPVFQILRGLSGAYNVALMKAVPKNDLSKDYLFYLLQESSIQDAVIGVSQRSAGQSGVDKRFLEELSVPIPPLSEQQRLAKHLTEKLAIIEQAKQTITAQLQAAQDLTAAYLREVFESEEAKGWEKVKFIELAVNGINNGVFKRREDFGQGIRLINVSDLYNALTVNINSLERVNVTEKELNLYSVEKGDLFFCRSSLKRDGIGWCAYVNEINEPVVFDCHLMRIRPDKEKLDSEYLAHYWGNPKLRNELINNSKTSTMTTMNQDDLSKIEIPLPSIDRQKELAKFFTKKVAIVEQLKTTLQSQLESINQLPAALLKQAFNGKL